MFKKNCNIEAILVVSIYVNPMHRQVYILYVPLTIPFLRVLPIKSSTTFHCIMAQKHYHLSTITINTTYHHQNIYTGTAHASGTHGTTVSGHNTSTHLSIR